MTGNRKAVEVAQSKIEVLFLKVVMIVGNKESRFSSLSELKSIEICMKNISLQDLFSFMRLCRKVGYVVVQHNAPRKENSPFYR